MAEVSIEVVSAIGRVYRATCGSSAADLYDGRAPFDAVFFVSFLGGGRARLRGALGNLDRAACFAIADKLYREYHVHICEVERHGVEETWDLGRIAKRTR